MLPQVILDKRMYNRYENPYILKLYAGLGIIAFFCLIFDYPDRIEALLVVVVSQSPVQAL